MAGLFTEMAGAVIDELEPYERTLVDPKVFTRIIAICANVAEHTRCPLAGLPTPPPMQFINACLITLGDYLWRDDLSFDVVEGVGREDGEIVIIFRGGRTIVRGERDPLRVAISTHKARAWNEERCDMDADTIQTLHSTYGS
jgi:hypothetical protein